MALFSKKQHTETPLRRRKLEHVPDTRASETSLNERYAFKRNRTLTGSVSSRVVSTNESNAQLKSPRVQAQDLTRSRRHIGAVLFLVLAGAVVLYGLIFQFTAGVVVKAQGNVPAVLDASYVDAIQSYLSSQPTERLRFMINADHLSGYLQTKIPEVAAVKIDGSAGFGKTQFIITMREPIVGWSINGRQQYVDSSGTSFDRNYFSSPAVQVVDDSGIQVQAGQAIASNRFLGFVGRAAGLAKAGSYKVTQVIIPAGTTRQVELRLEGIEYPIKLSIDRGVGEQIEDMGRAIRWLSAHGIKPTYLDVRVSGEAFYR